MSTMSSIKETVESVNAVERCKLVEEKGDITQVYVEAKLIAGNDDARTQEIKSIVRSIIGAVSIHHDVELDYRKIKVIDYKPEEAPGKDLHPRIQIVAAYQKRLPRPQIVVELYCLNQPFTGTARINGNLAEATFHAFADSFHQMSLGDIQLQHLQVLNNDFMQEKVVLLKILYTHPDGDSDSLMGVAEVREDLPLATVKATLDAVNRRIFVSS